MLYPLLAAAANSPAATAYMRAAAQTAGRDKACRLGQYFARLVAHLLRARKGSAWLATLVRVQATLSTTRKILRAGKFVDFLVQLIRGLQARGVDEVERVLGAGHKAGMAAFMLADTLGVMHSPALALVQLRDAPLVARLAMRAWALALASNLALGLYRLRAASLRAADVRRVRKHLEKDADAMGHRECVAEEHAVAQRHAAALRLTLVSALDLAIPTSALGLLGINEGLVALAGTVTSLMGIQDVVLSSS
ncbi:Peroxisomal membrane protein PMP27 [Coemansia thaxteri]|uniref:Peroxisomal membrane protein PMP27 n=1 Tax=Coemansia thaxteri TaxID=2663907 RepID=A0A9W8BKH8_9FUNG|nr:Peroxisomal membrane protein PMP27 [Coemansia thaxteri]KAJ2004502.1 Peroxisomal membrane protein PMP27 [Coemansia thaxteri]KAJ2465649.1 Peroxisomal membrane protein PMP27 [Coemansia sp. RSA 2322]KAJ2484342.1 Peroxisomal membrane protein PMP27 [Coemansia sp. RSA 2320]